LRTALRVFIVVGLLVCAVLVVAIVRTAVGVPHGAWHGWQHLDWWILNCKAAGLLLAGWWWTQRNKLKGWVNPKL
jgi:hypothetical protein